MRLSALRRATGDNIAQMAKKWRVNTFFLFILLASGLIRAYPGCW